LCLGHQNSKNFEWLKNNFKIVGLNVI